ncbi:hypothetical protein GR217_34295 [Rhizobium leguminosarum]|uniref:Uncharacterized protein n=1 Tax=Rhizobium ruizarguesonis TaxID=2081791 RepID=A0AAE5C702_9HYPH|nr:hypothetical protein [Rhizobium ruizarguesonis]NEI52691.1 hypothetical protein [Rhizobium ruizarguesonis]
MLTRSERVQISMLAKRIVEAFEEAQPTLLLSDCVLVAISAACDCGRDGGISEERLKEMMQAGAALRRVAQ